MDRYNYKQVHSTTGEIPYIRFKRALSDKVSLFREFDLLPQYKSTKDIFLHKNDKDNWRVPANINKQS